MFVATPTSRSMAKKLKAAREAELRAKEAAETITRDEFVELMVGCGKKEHYARRVYARAQRLQRLTTDSFLIPI
jgi:hypothetical protein